MILTLRTSWERTKSQTRHGLSPTFACTVGLRRPCSNVISNRRCKSKWGMKCLKGIIKYINPKWLIRRFSKSHSPTPTTALGRQVWLTAIRASCIRFRIVFLLMRSLRACASTWGRRRRSFRNSSKTRSPRTKRTSTITLHSRSTPLTTTAISSNSNLCPLLTQLPRNTSLLSSQKTTRTKRKKLNRKE